MLKKIFSLHSAFLTFQVGLAIILGMLIGALWRMSVPESRGAVATGSTAVKMLTRREGDTTRVYVQNLERSEITMTFDFSLVNLKGDVQFPFTASFAPGETQAFTLAPTNPAVTWEFSYTNYYKLGSMTAIPDSYVYSLPYKSGSAYRVTQGYDGSYSHKGSNKYAIDWKMPEGTPVYAARGGLVVKVKDDSNRGGGSMKFDPFNNYVLIRHDDGTLGHYCHLLKNGVEVRPGQIVQTGELIAHSGNTGFSSGPHLHFCVFKALNGRERESIPVQFKDAERNGITLLEGHKYTAAPMQSANLTQSVKSTLPQPEGILR